MFEYTRQLSCRITYAIKYYFLATKRNLIFGGKMQVFIYGVLNHATNYTNHVKTHFTETCHRVVEDQDVLLVTREDADNVVIMPQSLFNSILENASFDYLTRQNISSTVSLKIQKLNPLQYAQAPTEPFQTIVENETELVFADIEDSAAFAKKLRQQAWRHHE